MRFKFCPQCGNRLIEKLAGDDGLIPFCDSCKKFYFDSFASCVIILVANELHEIAMLHQSYLSLEHRTFVAGFIKPGESAEETAIREVKEELGIDVERLEYAGTYWFGARDQLMHGFIGFVRKQDFKLSSEVDDAEWISLENAPNEMFPERLGNSQQPIYRKYLELISE